MIPPRRSDLLADLCVEKIAPFPVGSGAIFYRRDYMLAFHVVRFACEFASRLVVRVALTQDLSPIGL
jgi:hypothetical protein